MTVFSSLVPTPASALHLVYPVLLSMWALLASAYDLQSERLPLWLTVPPIGVTIVVMAVSDGRLAMLVGSGLWAALYFLAAWFGQLGGADILVAISLGGFVGKYCCPPAAHPGFSTGVPTSLSTVFPTVGAAVLTAIAVAGASTALMLLSRRKRSGAHVPGMCCGCAVALWAY